MKLDVVLAKILTTLQKEIKDKYKTELAIEDVHSLVDVQFYGLILGVSKGLDVQLPKLGKFLNTNRLERRNDRKKIFKLLKENKELNPELDYESIKNIFIKEWAITAEQNKKLKKEQPILSAKEVIDIPVLKEGSFNIFKKLGNITKTKDEF